MVSEGRMKTDKELFDELEDLVLEDASKVYSELVIKHFMEPQNYGAMEKPDAYTFMSGICGDTIGFFLRVNHGKIEKIGFVTDGCGPTVACGSALTCMAQGQFLTDAAKISSQDLIKYLGGLPVENTHCADLAVNTLRGAIEKLSNDKCPSDSD